jgi:hypothetical protein
MKSVSMKIVLGLLVVSGPGLSARGDETTPCTPPPAECMMMPGNFETFLFAQGPGGEGMMRRGGRPDMPGPNMEQRKHLEQLRILKMLELLNLSKEQEVPFLTAFNRMREDLRGFEEQADQLTDSLAAELQSGKAEEIRLRSLIGRIKEFDRKKHERLMSFIDQSETMLTTEQVGKLMIFQRRFERELLEQVGRFRRGMHGPGAPDNPDLPEGEG